MSFGQFYCPKIANGPAHAHVNSVAKLGKIKSRIFYRWNQHGQKSGAIGFDFDDVLWSCQAHASAANNSQSARLELAKDILVNISANGFDPVRE